jgi:predicted GIY-YIG superfamily endonuclease
MIAGEGCRAGAPPGAQAGCPRTSFGSASHRSGTNFLPLSAAHRVAEFSPSRFLPREKRRTGSVIRVVTVLADEGDMDKRFVYVLSTGGAKPRYYVGVTSDVSARIRAHNNGVCRHTAGYRPWRLHVCVEFPDETRAAAFERYLKSGSGRAFARRHFE